MDTYQAHTTDYYFITLFIIVIQAYITYNIVIILILIKSDLLIRVRWIDMNILIIFFRIRFSITQSLLWRTINFFTQLSFIVLNFFVSFGCSDWILAHIVHLKYLFSFLILWFWFLLLFSHSGLFCIFLHINFWYGTSNQFILHWLIYWLLHFHGLLDRLNNLHLLIFHGLLHLHLLIHLRLLHLLDLHGLFHLHLLIFHGLLHLHLLLNWLLCLLLLLILRLHCKKLLKHQWVL